MSLSTRYGLDMLCRYALLLCQGAKAQQRRIPALAADFAPDRPCSPIFGPDLPYTVLIVRYLGVMRTRKVLTEALRYDTLPDEYLLGVFRRKNYSCQK